MVAVALVSAIATAAIVTHDDPDPATAVEGSLAASDDLTVQDLQLQYDGTTVTGVELTVDNSAGTERTGNAYLAIYDGNGDPVATTTSEGETFGPNGTTTITVSITETAIENVADIETTVQVTDGN